MRSERVKQGPRLCEITYRDTFEAAIFKVKRTLKASSSKCWFLVKSDKLKHRLCKQTRQPTAVQLVCIHVSSHGVGS